MKPIARRIDGEIYGNRYHLISLNFEVTWIEGELQLSNETTGYGYFGLDEIANMDIIEPHLERIQDIWKAHDAPFIRLLFAAFITRFAPIRDAADHLLYIGRRASAGSGSQADLTGYAERSLARSTCRPSCTPNPPGEPG